MKRAWTLAAAVVAVAVTTAVVFADQDQSSGVIFARSRTAKYSPLVPGVSSYVAWGDTAKGPFGGFTKFRPGYDAGMHTHTADVLLVVLRGAYLYRDDAGAKRVGADEKGVLQYPTRAASFKRLLGSPRQRHSQIRLLHRDQIKLAERLLIKQRPFLAISAAPVFVTTRNSDEIARADAFGTGIIPVQIGAT